MRAIFLTQSGTLGLFGDLASALGRRMPMDAAGFYVSDASYYRGFVSRKPSFEGSCSVLKEWEIVRGGLSRPVDAAALRRFEDELDVPSLWPALIADRRLSYNAGAALSQNYRPRFRHEEMLGVLEEGLVRFDRWFDDFQPDCVFGYICVTLGDYLGYLFARARGIPFFNLRPTRIQNFVTLADSIYPPSVYIKERFENYTLSGREDDWTREAEEFLRDFRRGVARYEGVVPPTVDVGARSASELIKVPRSLRKIAGDWWAHRRVYREDPYAIDPFRAVLHRGVVNRARRWNAGRRLGGSWLRPDDLKGLDYVFFPLHKEPEVTLLVYSSFWRNQIEVVRAIAQSLPVHMKVVVKEHPASSGTRSVSYYRKLLAIPNVHLAHPSMESRALVEGAACVTTIAGSVGLEAVLRRRPVITFGATPYEILPHDMVRRIRDPKDLPDEIRDAIDGFEARDTQIRNYVAATMRESVPVNLYSELLGRSGVFRSREADTRESEIDALAEYAAQRLRSATRCDR